MEYTEEEKKAIEYLKENSLVRLNKNNKIIAYGNSYKYYILNLLEKQQKEIDRLKGLKVVIGGMRSGKQLLKEIANDYLELVLKENKLQCISGHSIDYIIDLFERGFVLVDEEDYISKEKIREKIKELENQKISIKVGFEKIFETKMDNAKIIDTLRELLRGE